MSRFTLLISSPIIAFILWIVISKLGWVNIGLLIALWLTFIIIYVALDNRKTKAQMARIADEQRRLVKAELAAQAKDKSYNPLFPNRNNYTKQKDNDFTINLEIKAKSKE